MFGIVILLYTPNKTLKWVYRYSSGCYYRFKPIHILYNHQIKPITFRTQLYNNIYWGNIIVNEYASWYIVLLL